MSPLSKRGAAITLAGPQRAAARRSIVRLYRQLSAQWGPQNWWPAQSRFEVIAGAILTQNTNWSNVERALARLRAARALSPGAMRRLPLAELEQLIRSSGYYRQKAVRLKAFLDLLDAQFGGSLPRMFSMPLPELRTVLLAVPGIGRETADSILLYAGGLPIFVVDAYTRRIFARHGILPQAERMDYDGIRVLVEEALAPIARIDNDAAPQEDWQPRHPPSRMSRARRSELVQHYNEFHALLVRAGNQRRRKAELTRAR